MRRYFYEKSKSAKKVRGLIVRGFHNKLPVTIDCIEKENRDVEVYLNGCNEGEEWTKLKMLIGSCILSVHIRYMDDEFYKVPEPFSIEDYLLAFQEEEFLKYFTANPKIKKVGTISLSFMLPGYVK